MPFERFVFLFLLLLLFFIVFSELEIMSDLVRGRCRAVNWRHIMSAD